MAQSVDVGPAAGFAPVDPAQTSTVMAVGDEAESMELSTGAQVGRFVVLAIVGKGGMGEVYAAFDPDLDRKVAVKLLRGRSSAGVNPSEGRARLLREAQTIAKLSDPNVVTVYDVGTFDGRVFLAMEFVEGHTLTYWLHARTRGWREILDCYRAAGRGLAAAHKRGIVHRDFKPDNVMVSPDGGVRVMDFGLARTVATNADLRAGHAGHGEVLARMSPPRPVDAILPSEISRTTMVGSRKQELTTPPAGEGVGARNDSAITDMLVERHPCADDEPGEQTRDLTKPFVVELPFGTESQINSALTQSGAMMGTPAYMAPEQFQGKEADSRSDQFAFCVALFEGLYGRRPFGGRTLDEMTLAVTAGVVREPPIHTTVPSWVRRLVLRGLRVNPQERFASMEDLLGALARDPAKTQRRWMAGAAIALVIAGLTTGLVRADHQAKTRCLSAAGKWAGVWEVPGKSGALSPRKQAIRSAFLATGKRYAADSFAVVAQGLDRYVNGWNAMHREACEAANVRGEQSGEVLDLRMTCLHDRLAEVRALTAVFLTADGAVVSKSVGAAHGLRPIEPCADVATLKAVLRPPDEPERLRVVANLRSRLADVGAKSRAGQYGKALMEMAVVLSGAEATEYAPLIAEAHLQMGTIHQLTATAHSKAEHHLEQAVWLAEGCRHDEVALEASIHLIAECGYFQARTVDAERWGHLSDAILRRVGPGHDVMRAWRLNDLAMLYYRQGRYTEALDAFEKSNHLKIDTLGPVHFDVGISDTNLAFMLHEMGRTDAAIERNQRALSIFNKTVGANHPLVALATGNAAEFLRAKQKFSESRALAQRALELFERESPEGGPHVADALVVIGRDWVGDKKPMQAVAPLERAVALLPEGRKFGAMFALAQATWQAHGHSGRALQIAKAASSDAEAAAKRDPRARRQKAIVDEWIDEREGQTAPWRPISMR